MKRGDIINFITTHPSFSWNNGLFVIDEIKEEGIINMIKIEEDYSLQSFDDGRPMITCIGIKNPGIYLTKMKYIL